MKSKIIKAVGKEILSLVCIILSIIGLLFVGHWLYSISNILVWIVLIITIFKLDRNTRNYNRELFEIEKIIQKSSYNQLTDDNNNWVEYINYQEKREEENFLLYLENKKIEISEFIENNNLPKERKDNLKIELDIFIMKATKEVKRRTVKKVIERRDDGNRIYEK